MSSVCQFCLSRSSKQFKDQFISPYTPVFKDGWVPPEVIAGKDVSNLSAAIAANAANAAAVAQLTDGQRKVQIQKLLRSSLARWLDSYLGLGHFWGREVLLLEY